MQNYKKTAGQALVTLLFFVIVATVTVSAAVGIAIANLQSSSSFDFGNKAYFIAESGIENAVIRLIRDPSYSGETMNIDNGTAVITVNGTSTYVIVSQGSVSGSIRKIQIQATYNNSVFTVNSWKEAL